MAAPDMDVIKEIPGYKVILKAVLKSQIQQLVEQLASHTNEESIILTASISDGTLSHLGSDSGKFFLEDHEDVKSQFLGFCLKHHHRKKEKEKQQQEMERQQKEEEQRRQERQMQMMSQQPRFGPRPGFMSRSPRFSPRFSPRQQMRSPGIRHEPYPVSRPMKRPLNLDQQGPGNGHMKLPVGGVPGKVIKIEADDPDEAGSNQSGGDSNTPAGDVPSASGDEANKPSSSQPSSPSHSTNVKLEQEDKDDDAKSETSSTSAAQAVERRTSDVGPLDTGLSLDSDLSNLISGEPSTSANSSESATSQTQRDASGGEVDPNVDIKLEAITESEMELEITGVEPGRPVMNPGIGSQDAAGNWAPNMPGAMGFDPSEIPGMQGGSMAGGDQGYKASTDTKATEEVPQSSDADIATDEPTTSGGSAEGTATVESPYSVDAIMAAERKSTLAAGNAALERLPTCPFCGKQFPWQSHLQRHMAVHTGNRPYRCDVCGRPFSEKSNLKKHRLTHMRWMDLDPLT